MEIMIAKDLKIIIIISENNKFQRIISFKLNKKFVV